MRDRGSEEREAVAAAVTRYCAGIDPEANGKVIFDRYAGPLFGFFRKRGYDRDDAHDLAQKTLSRVYKNMARHNPEASFDSWVFCIASNVWKNALRDAQTLKRGAPTVSLDALRTPADPDTPPSPAAEPVDPGDDPERHASREEQKRVLHDALEILPEKMRRCVMLKLAQDRTNPEIATLMKISVSTVKSQLKEARARLRPILEDRLGGSGTWVTDL